MVFIPTAQVKPGMVLARDLRMFDAAYGHSVLLTRGQVLSATSILRICALGFSGIYIDDGADDPPIEQSIRDELRVEFITGLKALTASFRGTGDRQVGQRIAELSITVAKLIDEIRNNEDFAVNIVDLKMYDDYTYHHSLSVAVIAITVGMAMNFNDIELKNLGLSAVLHDIGKLMIPQSIIQKPDKLTTEEFDIVKRHPDYATLVIPARSSIPVTVFDGIISHHERMDGSGYPNGLRNTNIPINGRILAVADVYDALTSHRPYRQPSLPSEASEYIMGGAGTYFDSEVVNAFVKKVAPYPVGTCVKLSNGEVGVVVQNDEMHPMRPVVRMSKKNNLIDLADKGSLNIVISGLGYS